MQKHTSRGYMKLLFGMFWVFFFLSYIHINGFATDLSAEEPTSQKEELITVQEDICLIQEGDFINEYYGLDQISAFSRVGGWEQTLQSRLQEAFDSCRDVVSVKDLEIHYTADKTAMINTYRKAMSGNHFYISGALKWNYNPATGHIQDIFVNYYDEYLVHSKPNVSYIQEVRAQFDGEVNKALSVVQGSMSQEEIALALHDYLVLEIQYDMINLDGGKIPGVSFNAYGAMVNKTAVCNGYAIAYAYLLQQCGIESYILSSDVMNHAWNMISMNGNWYHVDVTYDDPIWGNQKGGQTIYGDFTDDYWDDGYVGHEYFLRTDKEMTAKNYRGWQIQNAMSVQAPEAISQIYSNSFIQKVQGPMFYQNGYWYYSPIIDGNDKIYKTNFEGTDITAYVVKHTPLLYMNLYKGQACFATPSHLVKFDFPSETEEVIETAHNRISEMAVRNGQLTYVETDGIKCEHFIYQEKGVAEDKKKGDVTEDGMVNLKDLMQVLKYISGKSIFNEVQISAADINGDGIINLRDLMKMLQYVSGKIDVL
ncbi:MAG: dockerin type I domain-containing protein [Lachnospiraceae bacterium]